MQKVKENKQRTIFFKKNDMQSKLIWHLLHVMQGNWKNGELSEYIMNQ